MFGFAVTRNEFRIYKFERDSEIPRNSLWFSSKLHSETLRMNCIIAALNVGRVLKFYLESGKLVPAAIQQGTWVKRVQDHKQIKICFDHMFVKSTQSEPRLKQMKAFYTATSEVVNLEHLYLIPGRAAHNGFREGSTRSGPYLEICLQPVGKTVLPNSPAELRTALLCILRCVKELHSLGYYHTDIRWFNVVLYFKRWILIDCYDFCEVTDQVRRVTTKSERSRSTGVAVVGAVEWGAADDLAQVVALACAVEFQLNTYDMFAGVRELAKSVAAGETSADDVIDLVDLVVV
jgi:hypothetical protein